MFQWQFPRSLEEFLVFGIGIGPAALDVIDTQLVQLSGDDQFVVDGKRDRLALRAVPERCIESLDTHKNLFLAFTRV